MLGNELGPLEGQSGLLPAESPLQPGISVIKCSFPDEDILTQSINKCLKGTVDPGS